LAEKQRCDRCGSAGSIEFDMCQVCYKDYSREGRSGLQWAALLAQDAVRVAGSAPTLAAPPMAAGTAEGWASAPRPASGAL
jgi:hypothetical protein